MITDLIHLLIVLGALQGIFFALLLFRLPRGNRTANRFLSLFLIIFSVVMLGIVAYSSHWVLQAPHLGLLHTPFGACLGPPFWLYIRAQTQKDFRPLTWHWAAMIVPFAGAVLWLTPFYILPAEAKRAVLEASYTALPRDWVALFIASNFLSFASIAASVVLIMRHERVVREVYSDTSDKTLRWTRHFLYAGAAIFGTCVLMSLNDIVWADTFSNLLFSGIIYVFGYRAMRQPEIFADVSSAAIPETDAPPLVRRIRKYEKSGLSERQSQLLLGRLEHLMRVEKIYAEPTLNLQQLSERLNSPPHQTSQLLNQVCGLSFSDYINTYRVEHFKQALADPEKAHFSLLALAFESGFNSKAAFNAVFKKMTGLTPSDYKEKMGSR